ncbi:MULTISPECIES: TatD family hydrolase [Candidatus Ichthyocystis]|uniref:TatD DNase family protein n=1 Tax=Candidatus Ichthyocystis hellenicum TaxID=1561003 RepID=A0A0S4M6X2_9BURK|nr:MULTISPECIES: TatD family hydrolase [Ichthyocystis]CUT18022.1 TatD DNase family protein [Candidatus Ichthyocystis hellenicum]
MLVDSHCHIHFSQFFGKVSEIVGNMLSSGVIHALCVSVDLEDYSVLLETIDPFPSLSASFGIHPNHDGNFDGEMLSEEELFLRAQMSDRVVAIGETGLDYCRVQNDEQVKFQQELFRRHIRVAKQLGKPLIIHCRQAGDDVIRILVEEGADRVGGVMHCCTESLSFVEKAMDISFYISYSGIVTFKNAQDVQSVAKMVPMSRLLVETDSPYLSPVPFRGSTNQPAYVLHVADKIAKLKDIPVEDVHDATTANFFRLFPLSAPRTQK